MIHTFITALMLVCSNVFMTFAWYAHLKNLGGKPWFVAALISWGIAFFEYAIMVPANRIGHVQGGLSVAQLKVMQEVITLLVFAPFAIYYMGAKLNYNHGLAGVCLVGAVFFAVRAGG